MGRKNRSGIWSARDQSIRLKCSYVSRLWFESVLYHTLFYGLQGQDVGNFLWLLHSRLAIYPDRKKPQNISCNSKTI